MTVQQTPQQALQQAPPQEKNARLGDCRLCYGLRIRQLKLEAAVATGPVCGVARYSRAGRRAADNALWEEDDETEDNNITARSADKAAKVIVKEDCPARES